MRCGGRVLQRMFVDLQIGRKTTMTILLLFIVCVFAKASITSPVPPPDNVTVVCQNGTNIAYWNYTGASTAEFSVMIKNYWDGKILLLTNTSQHYVDISTVTPPDARDEYSLFLTTLDGSRISDKVLVTFSYGSNLKSDVECFLEFPSVNVTTKSNWTMFSFANPISFLPVLDNEDEYFEDRYDYISEQNDTLPNDDEEKFYYKVYTTHDQKPYDFECPLEADVCRGELPFRRCTTLKLEGSIDGIRYRRFKDICNITPEKDHWPIYLSVVICIIVLVLLVVILLGTQKVVKNFLSSHLPEILTHSRVSGTPHILQPEAPRCSKAGSTPLLQSPEMSPTESATVIPTESCPERTHFPIPAPAHFSGDQLGDDYDAVKPEPEPQPQIEDDDGYMQRERVIDTLDSSSVNDIAIEIAPEDHITGYGPR